MLYNYRKFSITLKFDCPLSEQQERQRNCDWWTFRIFSHSMLHGRAQPNTAYLKAKCTAMGTHMYLRNALLKILDIFTGLIIIYGRWQSKIVNVIALLGIVKIWFKINVCIDFYIKVKVFTELNIHIIILWVIAPCTNSVITRYAGIHLPDHTVPQHRIRVHYAFILCTSCTNCISVHPSSMRSREIFLRSALALQIYFHLFFVLLRSEFT
jgi:hypothetical protein